jgi:hypothetical protein
MSGKLKTTDEINILVQQYLAVRSELGEFVRHYRAHVNYTAVALTAAVGLISYVASADNEGFILLTDDHVFLFITGIVVTTILAYFVFHALEAQYAMFAVASHAAILEDMINQKAGEALVIWETKLGGRFWWDNPSAHFWWSAQSPLKDIEYPSKFLVGYMTFLIFLALFSTPSYSTFVFWYNHDYQLLGWILCVLNWIYSTFSFCVILIVGRSVLWRMRGPAQALARAVLTEVETSLLMGKSGKKL